MTYALGIDFGTAFTAAAVLQNGIAETVNLGNQRAAIPSVVLIREDSTVLTGEAAQRRAITEPTRVVREFKRRLGDPTPILIGGSPYSAEALTSRLVTAVLTEVRQRYGGNPSHIAVSYPANWGPYKTDLLKQALQMAGITGATLITEPQAAAISYAEAERLEPGETIAVYDLGGGTFDTAVLRKTEDGFEILGQPIGIERLGGMDLDAAVLGHVMSSLGDSLADLDEDDPATLAGFARLRQECTAAREALSSDTEVDIPVVLPGAVSEVRLTRSELESMIRPPLADTVNALHQALDSAGVTPDDLRAVLLVGGASRTPLVAQLVGSELGRPVAVDADPKHAIALGAAHTAAAATSTKPATVSEAVTPATATEVPAVAPQPSKPAAAPVTLAPANPATPTPRPSPHPASQADSGTWISQNRSLVGLGAFVLLGLVVAGFLATRGGDDTTDTETAVAVPTAASVPVAPSAPGDSTDTDAATTTGVRLPVRATVDAGSVFAVDKTNPVIGTDLVATLDPPEYASIRQVEGRVIGFIDVVNTSNIQYYDFASFQTTNPERDRNEVWAELAPEAWRNISPTVPDSFEALGLEGRDPVAGISFDAADIYCQYALKRLPTELEWELAARDGSIDVTTVQNWVAFPEEYSDTPAGVAVLRGSFGIEALSVFYRTFGDSPTNRQNAGLRCAADDVVEVPRPTGELLYAREFSGADELHDWPDLHDPNTPDVAYGYHAPDVFHVEVRGSLAVAVGSGQVQADNTTLSADVELRLPDEPNGGFRYGLVANAGPTGYLGLLVQDASVEADGRELRWCVVQRSNPLITATVVGGQSLLENGPCELEGVVSTDATRNTLTVTLTGGNATFSVAGQAVGSVPAQYQADASFGFIAENLDPSILSHVHFDNLTLVSS